MTARAAHPYTAGVLLFPCLVQLPYRHAPRPAAGETAGEGDRFQLVLENVRHGDAATLRAGSGL